MIVENVGRCGMNSRSGERAKCDGDTEGHWEGENSPLWALLTAVKELEESLRIKVNSMIEGLRESRQFQNNLDAPLL